MKLSQLFTKTTKDVSAEEVSKNAQLLLRAGYIDKLTAGVYSYLPLGLRVLSKITSIVREEMNAIGAQEVLMPSLHPKANWETTGRWADEVYDALFKTKSRWGTWEYAIGPTHEEIVVPLAKRFIQSYRDLPVGIYQIQTKFRDEARAKSGLLRGREFIMKDLYSFHRTEEDRAQYYKKAIQAYLNVYKRCGFSEVLVTESGGGSFTDKHSHEFQIITEAGEDTIHLCRACGFAQNDEIATVKPGEPCPNCGKTVEAVKAIEAGNIFDLGTKFAKDFELTYTDEDGERKYPVMGCYGIGVTRTMGALVEATADEKGLNWPITVAPFHAHLVVLGDDKDLLEQADQAYETLQSAGIEVLYDNRSSSNGAKLSDADLLGMPVRLIISKKTAGKVEYKERNSEQADTISLNEVAARMQSLLKNDNRGL